MVKKRKNYRLSSSSKERKRQSQQNRVIQHKIENRLLAHLYSAKKPVAVSELVRDLSTQGCRDKEILSSIEFLLSKEYIRKNSRKKILLRETAPIYAGTLDKNEKGFGFVIAPVPYREAPPLSQNPYIHATQMNSAFHGDKVLIRLVQNRHGNRTEGQIIKILSRRSSTIAGFYIPGKQGGIVQPEDPRFPFPIKVGNSNLNPHRGDAVIVQLKRDDQSTGPVSGKITELLGSPDKIDVQMRLVIEKFSLPHVFSKKVIKETEGLSNTFTRSENRLDLRHIEHITIDGETAKDFDDAICVEKTPEGFRLYVSIADVSHFIPPGSHLDKEAYLRGTSIYFPGRVIPMLPEQLSNNLCSLMPGEDRFTVTAILNFDKGGKLLKKEFSRSVIRSHQRFTYTTVKQIVVEQNQEVRQQHKQFLTRLDWAGELAEILLASRQKRGSIGFTLTEPKITLTEAGEIASISTQERSFAHQIIEEFMLAANEAVAKLFSQSRIKALYRIHEQPDFEKVEEFYTFAKTLDLHLPQLENRPEWFANVIERCRGKKSEYLINNLLLRTMRQARYSPENAGHFGLASDAYTHFTSPIRRYPDLLVHRLLLGIVDDTARQKAKSKDLQLEEKGEFLSARERVAIKAEREMNERLKVRYMQKRIGESFPAIISGVNDFAIFVELKEMAVSGSIGIDELQDDYYIHDAKRYRMVGELSGTVYQVGDSIQVTLLDVDCRRNRISFIPSPDNR